MTEKNNSNTFWIDYIPILFTYPQITAIIPLPNKNYIYNLNAITRFFIIFVIISIILKRSNLLLFSLISIIICVIVYKTIEEDIKKQNKQSESFINIDDNIDIKNSVNDKLIKEYKDKLNSYINESDEYNKKFKFYNDVDNIYKKPSYDNVYNIPVEKQFNNLDKLEPIKETNDQEYLNNTDAYSYINNQRFNIPLIENDKVRFANWLYKGLPNCKTDQYQCIKEENLKLKSKII